MYKNMSKQELLDALDNLRNITTISVTEIASFDGFIVKVRASFHDDTEFVFTVEFNGDNSEAQRRKIFNIVKDYNDTEVSY